MFRTAVQVIAALANFARPLASQAIGHALVVSVFNRSGDLIVGALVDAVRINGDSTTSVHALTDSDGNAIVPTSQGAAYRVSVKARGYSSGISVYTAVAPRLDTLRVRLTHGGCVGDVCYATPRSADHLVLLVTDSAMPLTNAWVDVLRVWSPARMLPRDTTDAGGRAGLEEPSAGEYRIVIRALGKTPMIFNIVHRSNAFDTVRADMHRACIECGGYRLPTRRGPDSLPPRAPEPALAPPRRR